MKDILETNSSKIRIKTRSLLYAYTVIYTCNCKKSTCVTKLLKICVASYVLLILLELITFVTLLATYPLPSRDDPLCTLWLAWGLQFLRGN